MITLTVIQPVITACSEDFNKMHKHQSGAFCDSCNKVVHDLSALNTEQLITFIQQHPGACGRVQSNAMRMSVTVKDDIKPSKSFSMRFAFALLVVFGPLLFSCTEEQHHQIKEIAQQEFFENEAINTMDTATEEIAIQNPEYTAVKQTILDEQQTFISEITDTAEIELETVNVSVPSNSKTQCFFAGGLSYTKIVNVISIETDTTDLQPIKESESLLTNRTLSLGVYPNPTVNLAEVKYSLHQSGPLLVTIFNLAGQEMLPLVNDQNVDAGQYTHNIDVASWPSGVYLVVLVSGTEQKNFKFTVAH